MIDIKEAVRDNKKVEFTFYRNNQLWYTTEQGDTFPVPIEDTGDGVFGKTEKALLFMRYMRKWNKILDA